MSTDLLASVALGALGLYLAIALVGRSLLQRRRTGSTGWRGISGKPGSAEWWAGVCFGLAAVGLVVAPVVVMFGSATLVGWSRVAVGAVLFVAGTWITVKAQLDMGDSWRIGVQQGERTELRTGGLFGWCRNPIFTGMLLAALAMVVWVPIAGVAWLALWFGLELQVRVVEEPHLLSVHGEDYQAYAERTGRFLPGFGVGLSSGA